MIVWINGTFGVGKTTTSRHLNDVAGWPVFDPEHVGYLVGGHFRDLEFDDFQDLPPWRALVPKVAEELLRFRDTDHLIAVQTVLRQDYWDELVAGFAALERRVLHVVLDCDPAELERRIRADEEEAGALGWRLDHLDRYAAARNGWLLDAADVVVETTSIAASAAAEEIERAVRA
jgi:deoxyadenosine/deoxycytidine kinase